MFSCYALMYMYLYALECPKMHRYNDVKYIAV